MSKTYGLKTEFAFVRKDASRIIVSYNRKDEADGQHCTWDQVCFYKKQTASPTKEQIKDAIIKDINDSVVRQIHEGFEWKGHKVWLSLENQANYKAAADLAEKTYDEGDTVTFRFGDEDAPDPYTFEDANEVIGFWEQVHRYIVATVKAGWDLKASIDWSAYIIE